ncbi:MAG: PRC-barrel domain-containing protein [Methanobrevibacter sp.]|uniref:PRC-barrel domain-containing protein n=1 Tax=Methanobrevibacter sp. TaxID=66852 RepID=UPI0026DF01E1|nr:PRC-barrel domain-containing protein [Methanobrevibacter sp.]MDO5848935.1 PRC-barrel domain-containing protein [Methanobrevibacter sp.]
MVKVSSLYDLDIYTITGQYVGRVADVILNIRLGTISKLQVRAIEPEKKEIGLRGLLSNGFRMEQQDEVRSFKHDLLTIDFDKVQAIGDIMLINPRDIRKVKREPPIPEAVTPQSNQNAKKQEKHRVRAEKL